MSNDAEAREVHATVTDSEEPWEPVNGDRDEPVTDDRTSRLSGPTSTAKTTR